MKHKLYILLICCCLFTSCWHRYTSVPQIESYIYNAETLKPEKDVTLVMQVAFHAGGGTDIESLQSDSIGFVRIEMVENSGFIFPGMEGKERVPRLDTPVILKKESYLNDTIMLERDMIRFENDHYIIDTLYFRARKIQDHKTII